MPQHAQVTVLVVDDEEQIRRAVKSILTSRQYGVLLAATGEEGLDLAAEHNPSLIILDLSLPDISGLEVCRSVRAWYTGPILILSVRGNEKDKVTALELGADDYLTKPFSTAELLAAYSGVAATRGNAGHATVCRHVRRD